MDDFVGHALPMFSEVAFICGLGAPGLFKGVMKGLDTLIVPSNVLPDGGELVALTGRRDARFHCA